MDEGPPLSLTLLPRRQRNLIHSKEYPPFILNFIRASIPRAQRLFNSIDELEREVMDSMSVSETRLEHDYRGRSLTIQFMTRAKDLTFTCLEEEVLDSETESGSEYDYKGRTVKFTGPKQRISHLFL